MPPLQLWIHCRVRIYYNTWVPPFGHPRIDACLRLPEAFSLFATSFFGSWRLGILRVLLLAYPSSCSHDVRLVMVHFTCLRVRSSLSSFQGAIAAMGIQRSCGHCQQTSCRQNSGKSYLTTSAPLISRHKMLAIRFWWSQGGSNS